MDYQTVNSREILIPELGITLHLHSVELPRVIAKFADGHHSEELDAQLVALCQEIFRLGPDDIISFSQWSHTTQQVRRTMDAFYTSSKDDAAYHTARTSVATAENSLRGPGDYLKELLTNGLLVPRKRRIANLSLAWFEKATSNEKLSDEFFASLSTAGVIEITFANWYLVNQVLYAQAYPSAVGAREDVPRFEIPVAGSKTIKAISIENFQKLCYGSAALVMTETALSTAATLGHGQVPAIAAVLGGSVSALVIASVGSLSRYLEDYLKSKTSLAERPGSKGSKQGRAAAA